MYSSFNGHMDTISINVPVVGTQLMCLLCQGHWRCSLNSGCPCSQLKKKEILRKNKSWKLIMHFCLQTGLVYWLHRHTLSFSFATKTSFNQVVHVFFSTSLHIIINPSITMFVFTVQYIKSFLRQKCPIIISDIFLNHNLDQGAPESYLYFIYNIIGHPNLTYSLGSDAGVPKFNYFLCYSIYQFNIHHLPINSFFMEKTQPF